MAHTNDPGALLLLWRLPLTRELGTNRGLSSSNRLQLMLQAELAEFATENTKLPLHLLMHVLKKQQGPSHMVHVLIVCLSVSDLLGGRKDP